MPRGVGFYGNVTAEDPLHDRAEADVKTNPQPRGLESLVEWSVVIPAVRYSRSAGSPEKNA